MCYGYVIFLMIIIIVFLKIDSVLNLSNLINFIYASHKNNHKMVFKLKPATIPCRIVDSLTNLQSQTAIAQIISPAQPQLIIPASPNNTLTTPAINQNSQHSLLTQIKQNNKLIDRYSARQHLQSINSHNDKSNAAITYTELY